MTSNKTPLCSVGNRQPYRGMEKVERLHRLKIYRVQSIFLLDTSKGLGDMEKSNMYYFTNLYNKA